MNIESKVAAVILTAACSMCSLAVNAAKAQDASSDSYARAYNNVVVNNIMPEYYARPSRHVITDEYSKTSVHRFHQEIDETR